jgi:uncharacterized membrane protein
MARTIGNRVAPAKFIAFMALLVVAAAGAGMGLHKGLHDPLEESVAKGFMLGFDIAAAFFLIACLPLLRIDDPKTMKQHAAANDANRTMLLVITAIVSVAVLVAVETMTGASPGWKTKLLIVGTLLTAWLFANTVYALHYAHLFVTRGGGVEFPGDQSPGYADFVYFSFTLGMTFQTSDVNVSDKGIRNVVTAHCFIAFVFNLGILAFTINVLGG